MFGFLSTTFQSIATKACEAYARFGATATRNAKSFAESSHNFTNGSFKSFLNDRLIPTLNSITDRFANKVEELAACPLALCPDIKPTWITERAWKGVDGACHVTHAILAPGEALRFDENCSIIRSQPLLKPIVHAWTLLPYHDVSFFDLVRLDDHQLQVLTLCTSFLGLVVGVVALWHSIRTRSHLARSTTTATTTLSSQGSTTTLPTIEDDTQVPNNEDISQPALVPQASPPVPTTADPEAPSASTDVGAVEAQSEPGVLIDDAEQRVDEVSAEAPVSVGGKAEEHTKASEPDHRDETIDPPAIEEFKTDNSDNDRASGTNELSGQAQLDTQLPPVEPELAAEKGEEDEAVTQPAEDIPQHAEDGSHDDDVHVDDVAENLDTTTEHDEEHKQDTAETADGDNVASRDADPRAVEDDVESGSPKKNHHGIVEAAKGVKENAHANLPETNVEDPVGDEPVEMADSEPVSAPKPSTADSAEDHYSGALSTENAPMSTNATVDSVAESVTQGHLLDKSSEEDSGDQAQRAAQESSTGDEPPEAEDSETTPIADLPQQKPDETHVTIVDLPEQATILERDYVRPISIVDADANGNDLDITVEEDTADQAGLAVQKPFAFDELDEHIETAHLPTPTVDHQDPDETLVDIERPQQASDEQAAMGGESAKSMGEKLELDISSSSSARGTVRPLRTPVADVSVTPTVESVEDHAVPDDAVPSPYDVPLPLTRPGSQTAAPDSPADPAEEEATGDAGASVFTNVADPDAESNQFNDSDPHDLPESTRRGQDGAAVAVPIQSSSSLMAFTGFGVPPPTSTFSTPFGVSTGLPVNVPVVPQFGNDTFKFSFSVHKDMASLPRPLTTPRFTEEFTYRTQEDLLSIEKALIEYEVFFHTPQRDVLVLPPVPELQYQSFYKAKAFRKVPPTAAFGPSLEDLLRTQLSSGSGQQPTFIINMPTLRATDTPSAETIRLRLTAESEQKVTFAAAPVRATVRPNGIITFTPNSTPDEYTAFVGRASLSLDDVHALELQGAYFSPIPLYRLAVHMPHVAELYLDHLADLPTVLLMLNSSLLFQQLRIVRHEPKKDVEIIAFWKCRDSLAALFNRERANGRRVPHIEFDKERITVSNQKLTPGQLAAVDDDDPQMRPYRDALSFYSS